MLKSLLPLVILIIVANTNTLCAQNYKLLPDSCTYCRSLYTLGGSTFYGQSYRLDPNSDTLFQGNTYMRVNFSQSYNSSYVHPYGVRQVGNKLYGAIPDSTQEFLLMDWDVNVGDTIHNLFSDGSLYRARVLDFDSTLMNGGYYLRHLTLLCDSLRWNLSSGVESIEWQVIWNERGLCNGIPGNGSGCGYGGVIHNIPINDLIISPIYSDPRYCTTDPLIQNSFGLTCLDCELGTNSLDELTPKNAELIKIVDFMGRETELKSGVPVILIYSDGTRRKVFQRTD